MKIVLAATFKVNVDSQANLPAEALTYPHLSGIIFKL